MGKNTRNFVSAGVILTFLFLASGSIPRLAPDKSDALIVGDLENCTPMPVKEIMPAIHVTLMDIQGNPLPNHEVKAFITYQKAVAPCSPNVIFSDEDAGLTDANGVWAWTAPPERTFIANNSQDLIRIQVKVPESHEYIGADVVDVFRYDALITPILISLRLNNVEHEL